MFEKFLEDFNRFFDGKASISLISGRIEITIDSQTLIISLPEIIGGQSKGLSGSGSV